MGWWQGVGVSAAVMGWVHAKPHVLCISKHQDIGQHRGGMVMNGTFLGLIMQAFTQRKLALLGGSDMVNVLGQGRCNTHSKIC